LSQYTRLNLKIKALFKTSEDIDNYCVMYILNSNEEYSDIVVILLFMLIIPCTSVTCESTFSLMKIIKTILRTKMNSELLNELLIIRCNRELVYERSELIIETIKYWRETKAKLFRNG